MVWFGLILLILFFCVCTCDRASVHVRADVLARHCLYMFVLVCVSARLIRVFAFGSLLVLALSMERRTLVCSLRVCFSYTSLHWKNTGQYFRYIACSSLLPTIKSIIIKLSGVGQQEARRHPGGLWSWEGIRGASACKASWGCPQLP